MADTSWEYIIPGGGIYNDTSENYEVLVPDVGIVNEGETAAPSTSGSLVPYKRNPDPRQKPPLGSILNLDHTLSNGLVGCWIMNEGGGNTIFNLGMSPDKGSFVGSGVEWSGNNIKFSGADGNYISTPDADIYSFGTSPFTMVSRIYPTAHTTTNPILSKYNDVGPFDGEWYFVSISTDVLYAQCLNDSATDRIKITGSQTVSLNTWSNVAFRYSGGTANTALNLFLNGIKDSSPTRATDGTYTGMSNRGANVTLGGALAASIYYSYFQGLIEYAYLFGRLLTDDEIAWLNAEPYANILQPKYWYMVDLGAAQFGTIYSTPEYSDGSVELLQSSGTDPIVYYADGSSYTVHEYISEGGSIINFLSTILGQSALNQINLSVSRELNSSITASSNLSNITLNTLRNLISSASAQTSITNIDLAILRELTSDLQASTELSSSILNVSRSIESISNTTTNLADIDLKITRELQSVIDSVTAFSNIDMPVSRELQSSISGQTVLNSIDLLIAGIINFISTISAQTNLSTVNLNVIRKIQSTINAETTLSDISLIINIFFESIVAGNTALSNIDLKILRELNSQIEGQTVLSNIDLKRLIKLVSTINGQTNLSSITILTAILGLIISTGISDQSDLFSTSDSSEAFTAVDKTILLT